MWPMSSTGYLRLNASRNSPRGRAVRVTIVCRSQKSRAAPRPAMIDSFMHARSSSEATTTRRGSPGNLGDQAPERPIARRKTIPPPAQKLGEVGLLDMRDQPAHREPVSTRHDALDHVVTMALQIDRRRIDVPRTAMQAPQGPLGRVTQRSRTAPGALPRLRASSIGCAQKWDRGATNPTKPRSTCTCARRRPRTPAPDP